MSHEYLMNMINLFPKATYEFINSYLYLWDSKKRYIGRISNVGFSLNDQHPNYEKIKDHVESNGVKHWKDSVYQMTKDQMELDGLI